MSELPAASRGTAKFQLGSILGAIPLLPRNTVLLFLRAYRKVISPLYGDVCSYYPSCSAYAVGAVQQHGAIKGMFLGAWRILRCNPWTKGGVDDVKPHRHFRYSLTPRGHVVPVPTRKD